MASVSTPAALQNEYELAAKGLKASSGASDAKELEQNRPAVKKVKATEPKKKKTPKIRQAKKAPKAKKPKKNRSKVPRKQDAKEQKQLRISNVRKLPWL